MNRAKRNVHRLVAIMLIGILAMTSLAGCFGGDGSNGDGAAANDGSGTSNDSADASTAEDSVLPATIEAHGNSYTIASYTLGESDEGGLVVICEGTGFSILPMKNNKFIIPVYCSIIEDGKEIEFSSFNTQNDGAEFIFSAMYSPDTIVFYPEDDRDARVEVPVS